jgi:four helix bundle protein
MSEPRQSAKNFQELLVWQKAHKMVLDVYKISRCFPKEEIYGLTSQLRRSAVSVPANIAEGFRKKGPNDKARFFNIAQGSLEESRYYLLLSSDLQYANTTELQQKIDEVGKMLDAYIRSILTPDF